MLFIVAYHISSKTLKEDDIRKKLALKLPEYMKPSYYVRLDKLPLTANGKLDHKALPDPKITSTVEYVGPETEEEEILTLAWSEVLGTPKISVTENFFALGGDSIKSIQVSSKMRNLGYETSVRDILESSTIRQLAIRN